MDISAARNEIIGYGFLGGIQLGTGRVLKIHLCTFSGYKMYDIIRYPIFYISIQMKRFIHFLMMTSIFSSAGTGIFGQQKSQNIDLKPNVAGQFYPAGKDELVNTLRSLFSGAKPDVKQGEVIAIISPHAGYIFSGQTAASAYNQLCPDKVYKTIFVIGTSHQMYFEGAAIYNKGNFITPMGVVPVNLSLANKIISENPVFKSKPEAFKNEHSLEVQLPFLQYRLKKGFGIIPIILGTRDSSECKLIATALKPYFNKGNLFVISSDFSHYPRYQNAENVDRETTEAILAKSSREFYDVIHTRSDGNIPNLSTRACAWTSILSLIYMVEYTPGAKIQLIDYSNSGESEYGDKSRVVGYNAISVILTDQKDDADTKFALSKSDKIELLYIARKSIEIYLSQGKIYEIEQDHIVDHLKTQTGAFVTLHKNGSLRGCIGRLSDDQPLYKVVQEMAVAAAIHDYRFDKVSPGELKNIDIEISVLSPLKRIKSIEEIEPGKHGIYIKKGAQSGTFLPQVANETGWNREELLGHCAKDKAMIGWDGWKGSEIYTYEAYFFSEKELLK
jgi:AmmeMemoRadiSam system protein B/AmmeMemoRadiSam system protein A